jgi:hypothetical protein
MQEWFLLMNWYPKVLSGSTFLLRVSIAGGGWKDKGGGFADIQILCPNEAHQLLCGL